MRKTTTRLPKLEKYTTHSVEWKNEPRDITEEPLHRQHEIILSNIFAQALNSWGGREGLVRANSVADVIERVEKEYSEVFDIHPYEVLLFIENRRDYCCVNYYQEANFPSIEEGVKVFDTMDDFKKSFPSKKFICPKCEGISTDPQRCNSGFVVSDIKDGEDRTCNWCVGGLFRDLGKGMKIAIKELFLAGESPVITIFKPIELQESSESA